jgi:hypothetical protein
MVGGRGIRGDGVGGESVHALCLLGFSTTPTRLAAGGGREEAVSGGFAGDITSAEGVTAEQSSSTSENESETR